MTLALLRPEWPAPACVAALVTTRAGGHSAGPYGSLNLGDHVGDAPALVGANRAELLGVCEGLTAISWLQQVHGIAAVAADGARVQRADAQFTRRPGLGCAIMTADCLPVLFCDRTGTQVAAAHAGWRGLCAGILERTLATFAEPAEVLAWLGPAIGPANFEVGAEVREQFLAAAQSAVQRDEVAAAFVPAIRAQHFFADIYALARIRLRAAGTLAIYGGGLCTVAAADRFFSYRRDAVTGRMASLIYLNPAQTPD